MEGRASFLAAGGKEFHYSPALNEHPHWIAAAGQQKPGGFVRRAQLTSAIQKDTF